MDAEISHPYYSDFYLVSHGGLLGTSKVSLAIALLLARTS